MTTYRLPEALGGGELESMASDSVRYPNLIGFCTEGEWFWVAKGLLTEVKELPEEPPVGSFVLVDATVLQRKDSAGIDWWDYGQQTWRTWEQVCQFGTPVRLVPDPFAEPAEVPWEHGDRDGSWIGVFESQRPWAAARVGTDPYRTDMTPEACRYMARVLWATADAHEREATP
jgi:hypothetical protein